MRGEDDTGWYLGLPYMQGVGLRAVAPGEISPGSPSDFLFVDNILNACPDWKISLQEWWGHLGLGAHLILWLKDCTRQEASGHRFTLEMVDHALDGVEGWEQLECGAVQGHIFAVYRKLASGQVRCPWRKREQHLLLIRAGAYGDAVMTSSVLPLLRQEGWTVDVLTSEAGEEVLRHDPHIARLMVTGKKQVEDSDLGFFWAAHGARYDRVINLMFSVEGELLKQPFRGDYFWSDEQRRALCGRSYLGHIHELSGIEKKFAPRFYPNEAEKAFTRRVKQAEGPFILWCLRGSAVHKWWPYAPQAVCRILAHSKAKIILSGGDDARDLARDVMKAARDYFGETGRLVDLTGQHTIREMMALAQAAALVIGPETGVLNAVSFEKMPKIVFLSHSSARNLTDDWVNARALVPKVPCYPCHRLHYGSAWCPQDEKTGAAVCAAAIGADEVVDMVLDEYRKATSSPLPEGGAFRALLS